MIIQMTYGYKILEKEFNWVGRKTIRSWLFLKYEYYVHTSYMKIGPFDDLEDAWYCKVGMGR